MHIGLDVWTEEGGGTKMTEQEFEHLCQLAWKEKGSLF